MRPVHTTLCAAQWQVCAAKGNLPGQGSDTIIFSYAPKDLQLHGGIYPLGGCNSYAPRGCRNGYASGDIFYLEVCLYDVMCKNRDSLWALKAGEPWHCQLNYFGGFKNMYQAILQHEWPDDDGKDKPW